VFEAADVRRMEHPTSAAGGMNILRGFEQVTASKISSRSPGVGRLRQITAVPIFMGGCQPVHDFDDNSRAKQGLVFQKSFLG
jgi:hypothetical protein